MTKKLGLTVAVIFIVLTSFAQQDTTKIQRQNFSLNLKASYNSSIVYPGLRIGTETMIKRIELTKTKKQKNKLIFKDRLFTTNLSFYHHPTFHTNTYITAGYTFRRTREKGFFTEFCPEIGYSRIFLGGTTYIVDNSGTVSIKKLAGYNYALVSVGLGVGYDFSKIGVKPISIFYKFNIISMLPYNSTFYIRPAMELGVIYKPKKLLSFNAKTIRKSKTKNNEK